MRTAERIESLKAGSLAAIVFTGVYCLLEWVNPLFISGVLMGNNGLIRIAITLLSGFLFGVTYRHLISVKDNSHLKDGAVLAFGLVRGLVPLEISGKEFENSLFFAIFVCESLICFAIARLVVDMALKWDWIQLQSDLDKPS